MTYQLSRQAKVCVHIGTDLHALIRTKWILNEPLSVSREQRLEGKKRGKKCAGVKSGKKRIGWR